ELAELLGAHPDLRAFVEIKRVAIERLGSEAVLERVLPAIEPVASRCALISFSLPFLSVARARCRLPLGTVFDRWKEREQDAARALEAEFVFCDVDGLPRSGAIEERGSRVAVYEVDDARKALDLAARGVDLVETFAIGPMRSALRELAS